MADVLIAYNSNPEDASHSFYDACHCHVRQISADNGLTHNSVTGESLTEENVIGAIPEHRICVAISHGDSYGIFNEAGEYYISTHTTNYAFKGKGLYAISCSCGQNLKDELMRIGLSLFVGYKDELRFLLGDQDFIDCTTEGVAALLNGKTLQEVSAIVSQKYYDTIDKTEKPEKKWMLFHNLNNLVIDGQPSMTFQDLQ